MMDIRKKHVYFTVCTISTLSAILISLALVLEKVENGHLQTLVDKQNCIICSLVSRVERLKDRVLKQESAGNECVHRLLEMRALKEEQEDDSDHNSSEVDEKNFFHEYLMKELFANYDDEHREYLSRDFLTLIFSWEQQDQNNDPQKKQVPNQMTTSSHLEHDLDS